MNTRWQREDQPLLALASAVVAPTSLIGGWTVAASLQPGRFDARHETISALAALDTPHRWVMTAALVVTGIAHIVTAAALPQARRPGRIALAAAGLATLAVVVFPLPSHDTASAAHTTAATVAFTLLGVWPALAASRSASPVQRPRVAWPASGVLVALALWVGWALTQLSPSLGLIERLAAGGQSLWPLVAATSAWWAAGRPLGSSLFRHATAWVVLFAACCLGGTAATIALPTTAETRHYEASLTLSLNPVESSHLRASTVFGDIVVQFSGLAPGIDAHPQVKASIAEVLSRRGASIHALEPGPLELGAAIRDASIGLGFRFALGGVVTAAVAAGLYAGWHRRRPSSRLFAVAALAWLSACAVTGVAIWQTYQPGRQTTFRTTGVLGTIQRNASILSDVEERSAQAAPYLRNLLALSSALQDKYAPTPIDTPTAARILLVSDIHAGNQYPLMRTIVREEHIDAVIDAGDLVNLGPPTEAEAAGIFEGIRSLGVPYLFVKGNHDANTDTDTALLDRMAKVPNVVLLQPDQATYQTIVLNGIRINGFNDPRWFGDDNRDSAGKQKPATDAYLRTFAHREVPDIVVSHEPAAVRPISRAAIVVNGHIHSTDLEGHRIQVGTFTGGGPLSHFIEGQGEELTGQPSAFDILTFGQDCRLTSLARYQFRNVIEGRPAYDDVSLVNGSRIATPPAPGTPARTCGPDQGIERITVPLVALPQAQ
ncbi:MAG TPA: DUF998 domain-containing protein [Dermatophilaceae bacterium]|nr:DUF998 domain-containing protein [Dermatophilaceae bacterium]